MNKTFHLDLLGLEHEAPRGREDELSSVDASSAETTTNKRQVMYPCFGWPY